MKLLKWLSLIFVILVGLCFFALRQSHYILSKNLVEKVSKRFIPKLKLDFDSISLNIIDHSLFEKTVIITTTDSCHTYKLHKLCVENFELEVDLSIRFNSSFLIKKLILKDKSIFISSMEETKDINPREFISVYDEIKNIKLIHKKINDIHFNSLQIDLDNIKFEDDPDLALRIYLSNKKLSVRSEIKKLLFNIDLNIENKKVSGLLEVSDNNFHIESSLTLDLREDIILKSTNDIQLNLIEDVKNTSFESVFVLNEESLDLQVSNIKVIGDSKLSNLKVRSCSGLVEYLSDNIDFDIKCSGIYSGGEIRSLNVKKSILNLDIDLLVKEKIYLSKENFNFATLALKGISTKSEFIGINFFSQNSLLLNLGKFSFEPLSLDWNLKIKSYQKLVEALKGTKFSIPAPLNSLKGEVLFKSSKLIKLNKNINNIPFELMVKLDKDPFNQVDVSALGNLKYSKIPEKKSELDLKVNIKKLHLYLPDIDPIKGLPPLVSEKRIGKNLTPIKESKEDKLIYNIDVKTENTESIKIHYFMFKPFLALGLKAKIDNAGMSYDIRAKKQIDIVYLKRELKLLSFNLKDGSKKRINAEFLHKRGGYDIYLKVIGTPAEPRMLLSSSPSLSQSDITSVLLYGRTASSLNSAQKESVGGTEAAIVDRAFGLLSIWAFASTPIESVSYNPASKTYSAQISLPGEINFELGTNWEKVNSLSFRKRLNDTWSIITTYKPGDEESLGDVLLQKEFKFD